MMSGGDDSTQLLMEVVVRVSALEQILIKKEIVTEVELAEEIVGSMAKLKAVIDSRTVRSDNV